MKYSKSFIQNIVVLQRLFKYKKGLKLYLDSRKLEIESIIISIAESLSKKLITGIINNNDYNVHLSSLDKVKNKCCDTFSLNISLFEYSSSLIRNCISKINILEKQLKELVLVSGIETLEKLYNLFNIVVRDKDLYYNDIFIPTSISIYDNDLINNKNTDNQKIKVKEQSLIDIFSNIINKLDNIDNEEEDINMIKDLNDNKIIVTKLNGHDDSVLLSLFGAKLYIRYKKNIYVISGYFKRDPLNIYRNNTAFQFKNTQLKKSIPNISHSFQNAFMEQITIRDYMIYDSNSLIIQCQDAYNELNQLKQKTISSLVKHFLSSNFEKQRRVLTLFLLTEDNTDTQYLAYIMYDMISNESCTGKTLPLAEQIFNSLHWSVQKKFKMAINKVEKYTQSITDFNENDIPYDKRICLLKAPDNVKSKAMDKLKEINNRSSDSSVKAQQYLDGLLRIPFGINIKEEIINYLNDFKKLFMASLGSVTTQNKDIIHIQEQEHSKITAGDIDSVFDIFDKNENLIETELDKCNVKDLKTLIKNINAKFNLNMLVSKKVKSQLIEDISNKVQNNKNIIELIPGLNNEQVCETELINSLRPLKDNWLNYKNDKTEYMTNVRNILNNAVYGHDEPKLQIERIIAQWINGNCNGYCFGFEGPPGTGKTTIAKKGLTKCLANKEGTPRPFSFIPIGGSTNGSSLEGHCYTYVGSTWGRIVDVLMESKCMNPIIFIDELDKVSNTEHGKEIIGILTHMTDSSQNDEFIDKYFSGIKIDLSKALIIFSYNDPDLIDRILLDRIHRIKFKPLSKQEKFHVTHNHLLPEIFSSVGINKNNIIFSDEIIEFIIENYTFEAGARKLKEKLFEIVREINLRNICKQNIEYPFIVTEDFITKDIFSDKPPIIVNTISICPRIGLVNGLYATATGLGGITVIETFEIPSDSKFNLELTGQQGDVMKESMKVARTVAWNILPNKVKQKLYKKCDEKGNFGIHIHCPEGGTPKDGPSAGGAITLAIISLLSEVPINNTIGITGEIDLNGSIRAIGGLSSKVNGAKKAGVKTVLCPRQNKHDVDKIYEDEYTPIDDEFKIIMVDNIWDILKYSLCDNNLKFNNYTLERE